MGYQVEPYFVARRVAFRQRDSLASLPEYLMARSVAGSTHEDLITGIENMTQGELSNRFFLSTHREKFAYVTGLSTGWRWAVCRCYFGRGIPCDQSKERQDVRTEMVPVSTTNSLTARDSQHAHNASAGGCKGTQWMKQEHLSPPPASLVCYQRPSFS